MPASSSCRRPTLWSRAITLPSFVSGGGSPHDTHQARAARHQDATKHYFALRNFTHLNNQIVI